jgi:poly-gamma-glutamate synthesis protein (capsule biosynthesis protein)
LDEAVPDAVISVGKPAPHLRLVAARLVRAALALLLIALAGCGTAAPTPSKSAPSLTLAVLGDVMLGRDIQPSSETFAYLQPFLDSADLVLANLESPLTSAPVHATSPYVLCAPPERVRFLAEAGFDLLSLANNHREDCGQDGLSGTQSTLVQAGLASIGPGPEPVLREINGIHLAFLAFDATSGFNTSTAAQAVRAARDGGALVIVSMHWGVEYQAGASGGQQKIAARLAQAGATLIWGHHPHVLQPAEWADDYRTLVLYSLGNALFDQHGLESTRRSALVLVNLGPHGVEGLQAIPFVIDVHRSRIIEASPEEAGAIMQYFK